MKNKNSKKKKGFKLERRKSYLSIYEQIVKIGPLIADILKKDLPARDDDNILMFRVWRRQGWRENMSAKKVKYMTIMGKLAIPESISRTRRMLQGKHEQLRGEMYEPRHQAEEMMKTQLKLFS